MTKREIFDAYFINNRRDVPRMPMVEYAPYWDLTLDNWYKEGLDRSIPIECIQEHFGLDPLLYLGIDPMGEGVSYPDENGAPIINSANEYTELLPSLYPADPLKKVMKFIDAHREDSQNGTYMYQLTLNGFFWWPRTLLGIENHLFSFYDEPELYHRICKDLLEYNIRVTKEFIKHISPAYVLLNEDMSYNHGPMIGKDMWDKFLKPYYLELIKELKALGQTVIYDSDGDISTVIPWLIECGFDGILPLERMAGVDIVALTKQFPKFKFLGSFDKTVMKNGEAAMRNEFERILPAIKQGCYVPCVDHQTPPDVSMENYKIYIELLREYAQKAVCD